MPSEAERYRCREILGNLHLLYGLDSVAVEEEEAFSHAASCPDCRANLQIAAEVAGLGRRLRVPAKRLPPPADRIPRLVEAGLRENRRRLANAYYEIGRALVVEGAGPTARIEVVKPLKPLAESRIEGAQAIAEGRRRDPGFEWDREDELWRAFLASTGRSPLQQGEYALERTLRIHPGHEHAAYSRDVVLVQRGLHEDAEKGLTRLASRAVSSLVRGFSLVSLSWVLADQKRLSEASHAAKRALELESPSLYAPFNLFVISAMLKDYSALALAGRVLESNAARRPEVFLALKTKFHGNKATWIWAELATDDRLSREARRSCEILFS